MEILPFDIVFLFLLPLFSLKKRGKMPSVEEESGINRLKKEVEASSVRNELLQKENQELRLEVARLRAQINSLKARDNERRSMLWKKLQNSFEDSNTDVLQQRSSDFVKHPEKSLEADTPHQKPNSLELAAKKERLSKFLKPPPSKPASVPNLSPKEGIENKIKASVAAAPPPPPLPSKLLAGSRSVRRVPEVVELYRLLTRKDAKMENKTNSAAAPAVASSRNMIGEIENRSTYVSAIKSDVEKQKDFISSLTREVESAAFSEISDVELFVKWLDQELSSLVDERAVLKHFPEWPERKADALREAAFSYRDLRNLDSEVSTFQINPKESLTQTSRKMQALQDRLEQAVNSMERSRESASKKYKELRIPWEWMLDTGMIGQLKSSSLWLAREYMRRVTKELLSNACLQQDSVLLQGVRFAYRVHQFAGGFDSETIRAFDELKRIGLASCKS